MSDDRTGSERPRPEGSRDFYGAEQLARRHGITRMQAQQLIDVYGDAWKKLDAAARRLARRGI